MAPLFSLHWRTTFLSIFRRYVLWTPFKYNESYAMVFLNSDTFIFIKGSHSIWDIKYNSRRNSARLSVRLDSLLLHLENIKSYPVQSEIDLSYKRRESSYDSISDVQYDRGTLAHDAVHGGLGQQTDATEVFGADREETRLACQHGQTAFYFTWRWLNSCLVLRLYYGLMAVVIVNWGLKLYNNNGHA